MDTVIQPIQTEKIQDWLHDDIATNIAIDEKQPCEHLPEDLELKDWSYELNCVHFYLKCTCGKTIAETFQFSRRHVL